MGDGASKTMEERRGHRVLRKREGQQSRWGCGGRGEKGSTLRDAGGSVRRRRPGESVVVRESGHGGDCEEPGLASSAQATELCGQDTWPHLLHRLEESHRGTTPVRSGFSDPVHPMWAPPLTTQISETSRSYFYPYFTDEA